MSHKVFKNVPFFLIFCLIILKLFLVISLPHPMEIYQIQLASFLRFRPLSFQVLNFTISLASSFLFSFFIIQTIKTKKETKPWLFLTSFLLFFFNPWLNLVSTYHPICNIAIFLFTLGLKSRKALIFTIIALFVFFRFQNYEKPKNSFVNQLSFEKLAFEINERQKIDFLSVNKKYILPAVFRKATYNKPSLFLKKLSNHFISLFDFEQHTYPLDSYQILKLSRISPKGNINTFFLWELPIIFIGFYILLKKQPKLLKKGFLLVPFILIPYFVYEKKHLTYTAFLLIPLLLFLESYAINLFLEKVRKGKSKKLLIFITSVFIILIIFIVSNFYNLFFKDYLKFQTSHSFLYREISSWIEKNTSSDQKIIITDRFGPTQIAIPYYLNYKYENTKFEPIDIIKNELSQDTIYIGLIGEFVGKGKDLEEKKVSRGIELLSKIEGDEETVTEYGKTIWIGKY